LLLNVFGAVTLGPVGKVEEFLQIPTKFRALRGAERVGEWEQIAIGPRDGIFLLPSEFYEAIAAVNDMKAIHGTVLSRIDDAAELGRRRRAWNIGVYGQPTIDARPNRLLVER
jgi:hypothetical protein